MQSLMKPISIYLVLFVVVYIGIHSEPAHAEAPTDRDNYIQTYPATPLTPLDPRVKAALAAIPDLAAGQMTVEQIRKLLVLLGTVTPKLKESVARVENRTLEVTGGKVTLRIYAPEGAGPFPLIVHLHGGGWVAGSLDGYDDTCRALCHRAGAVVVAVDYRLAPEHRFPVPLEDCYAGLKWTAEHAAEIKGDPARLAVVGDSAGGNLTAAVSLLARDKGGPKIHFQALIYPATNASYDTASYHENATGLGLTREAMRFFWDQYLTRPAQADNPHACPLRAKKLEGLPPALVITAQYDVLRDDGEAYAARLHNAGVRVRLTRYLGMNHGFVMQAAVLPPGSRALQEVADAVKAANAEAPAGGSRTGRQR